MLIPIRIGAASPCRPLLKRASEPAKDVNQRNFEFKFKVNKLQGSLYRSDPDGKKQDQLLVDLIVNALGLTKPEMLRMTIDQVRKLCKMRLLSAHPDTD